MPITRRAALSTVPLAMAATSLSGSAFAQAQNPAPPGAAGARQAPGFYRYKVGDIEITAINDGYFQIPLDGLVKNAELQNVQQAAQEAFLSPSAFPIAFTSLVVNRGGRLTLIDVGNGDSGGSTSGTWMANFRAAGHDPANVATIIISHFHGDHYNGLRLKDGAAVFPNAEVMVPAAEWAFWMDDARMNQAPDPMKRAFQGARRVFEPIAANAKRYEADKEIVPGIMSIAAPGHTPGHMAYVVSSGQGKLIVMSDTANHPALFVRNPDWAAGFDMDGEVARQTRRRLLDMAASERAQVAFYHAPFPANGFIAKEGDKFRFVPAQWSSAS